MSGRKPKRTPEFMADAQLVAANARYQISEDIEAALSALNMTQSDLAKVLGVQRQYISEILKEKANFTIDKLAELSVGLSRQLLLRFVSQDETAFIAPSSLMPQVRKMLESEQPPARPLNQAKGYDPRRFVVFAASASDAGSTSHTSKGTPVDSLMTRPRTSWNEPLIGRAWEESNAKG